MPVQLQGSPRFLAVDENGNPRVGAKLFTYSEGTSTKKFVYQDKALSAAHTNPVVLNSNGEATIWLDGAYKFVLASSTDTDPPTSPYWTVDNVGTGSVADYTIVDEPLNKSFELNAVSTTLPDYWTLAGTGTWVLGSDTLHAYRGTKYIKLSDNIGTATSSFFEVTPDVVYNVTWAVKTGAAGPSSPVVNVLYYDDAFNLLSTAALPGTISSLSTTWANKASYFIPGSTARYAKLQFNISALAAGATVYIDALECEPLAWAQERLQAADGSATAPIYTFKNELVTGMYRVTGGTIGFTSGSGLAAQISAAGIGIVYAGTAALPSLHNTADTNTGMYWPAADTLALSTGGTAKVTVNSSGDVTISTGQVLAVAGSAASPSYSFAADANTGIYNPGADTLAAATGGTERMRVSSAGLAVTGGLAATGAITIPSTSYFIGNATYGYRFNNAADNANILVITDAGALTAAGVCESSYAPGSVQGGLHTFIESVNGGHATTFDIVANVTDSTWESVGPTGSGATNIWTAMDIIPAGAQAVILKIYAHVNGSTAGTTYSTSVYGRKNGSATAAGYATWLAYAVFINRSGLNEADGNLSTCVVPLSSSKIMDLQPIAVGTGTAVAMLVGYIR